MTDPNTSDTFLIEDFGSVYSLYYDLLNISYDSNATFLPDLSTAPCDPTSFSDGVMAALCAFYVLVFLLAVPGNLAVALVLGLTEYALSSSDLYLLHLAVADLLLAATLPFWATSVSPLGWVFGDAACKVASTLQELSFYASILFLAVISVDRYLVIVRGVEARKTSRRHASTAVCVAVWLGGALLSLPAGLFNSAFVPEGGRHAVCQDLFDAGSAAEWRLATRGLRHTLGFVLPLAVMAACYGVTVRRLLRTRDGFQRQRAMRVVVAVVVAFLLCWTPYHLAVVADTFLRARVVAFGCAARGAVDRAMLATQSLGLLHSAVNPLLYAFVGKKFRRRLVQTLRKTGVMKRASASSSSRANRSSIMSSEITLTVM